MPAGTAIIGRVAVKVIPDTSKFKEELRAKLDKDEKSAPPFQINTTVDMKGALIALREGLLKINEQNKNMDSRKIKFRTMISSVGMPAAINQAVRELNALAANKEISFRAGHIGTGVVEVQLSQASLDHVKKEMDHWVRANSPLQIPVHPTWTTSVAAIVSARLAFLTRPRTVPILPQVDNKALLTVGATLAALSGARFLQKAGTDLGDFLRGLDKAAPAIAAVGLALVTATGFGLTAASNILAFGSSLVSIGPAALALPGILGGIGIGIAATVVSMRDFNKIFPQFAIGVGRKTTAGNVFQELQNVMSSNFWKNATVPISHFLNTLVPQFSDGMKIVSTELGGFFGKLATSLTGAFNGALGTMFRDLSSSIAIASGGTDAYAGIIKNLGAVGAGYLPRLAQFFVNISVQFDSFIAKAAADGRLKGWIDTGVTALRDLGRVIANIAGIFAGFARAATAAGGSTFGIMADTLDRVNKAVSSPAFQTGLTSVLFAAHQAFKAIATQSGPGVSSFFDSLGKVLVQILPGAGTAVGALLDGLGRALSNPAFTSGVVSLFAGIEKAVNALYPAFAPLGAAFGILGPLIGTMVANLGPLVAQLIVGLGPAFTAMVVAITPLIPLLGGVLVGAITGLTAIISALTPVFVFFAEQAAKHTTTFQVIVVTALTLAGAAYVTMGIVSAINAAKVVAANVSMAISTAVSVAETIFLWTLYAAGSIASAATVVLSWISTSAAAVASVTIAVAQEVLAVLSWIAHGVAAAANALIVVAGWVATAAGAVAAGIVYVIQGALIVGSWVAMGIAATVSAIAMAAAWVIALGPIALVIAVVIALVALIILNWDTVKNATIVVWNAIVGAVSAAWNFMVGLVSGAVNAVMGVVTSAWNAIQNATSAVWNAIQGVTSGGVSGVVSFISSLPGRALGAMNALTGVLTGVASAAFSSMAGAVSNGIGNVLGFFGGIGGRILDSMGNLGGILAGAGRQIIDGFINGITGAFGRVRDTLSNLTSMLPSWKGPPKTDAIILLNAGQLVIGGFIDGLESRYDDVKKSLAGLSMEIGKTTIAAPDVSDMNVTGKASMAVNSNLASQGAASQRTLIYNAAPGSSLSSEESLWAAADRARMVGW